MDAEGSVYVAGSGLESVDLNNSVARMLLGELDDPVIDDQAFARPGRSCEVEGANCAFLQVVGKLLLRFYSAVNLFRDEPRRADPSDLLLL